MLQLKVCKHLLLLLLLLLLLIASPFVNDSGLYYSTDYIPHASYRELVCLFDGIPEPEIIWLRNGDLIRPSKVLTV